MKILAIQTGTVAIKRKQQVGEGTGLFRQVKILMDKTWTEPLPILAWMIDHPEGVIVVDTGDTAQTMQPDHFPSWHPYFRTSVRMSIRPEQEIGPQLKNLGVNSRDVKKVILTHFHTDHAGGISHFQGSDVFVNESDHRAASGFKGQLSGYLPQHWPSWFAPLPIAFDNAPFGAFATSFPITKAGDVVVVPTPGHTPGHVSVIARDGDLHYFLAGDTSYSEAILVAREVDGVSPDVQVALGTIDAILAFARERPTIYLPTHDALSVDRLHANKTLL